MDKQLLDKVLKRKKLLDGFELVFVLRRNKATTELWTSKEWQIRNPKAGIQLAVSNETAISLLMGGSSK
jgi:hypothetical protein